MTGVPVFIGFATPVNGAFERRGGPAVVIDRWDAAGFDQSIVPRRVGDPQESYLRMAIRGFFANGGKRCVMLAVPPEEGVEGLVGALRQNGPLVDRSDIDLICIPDAVLPEMLDRGALREIHDAALTHCEAMGDRFAILDPPTSGSVPPESGPHDAQDAVTEILDIVSSLRSAFGALYFPWIVVDPASDGGEAVAPRPGNEEWRYRPRLLRRDQSHTRKLVPPCGHIAGLFARIDTLVGPHHAPANAILEGVVDTSCHLSASQHALLNDGGVNCLRSLRGTGVEVSGARTLSGHSAWAYVSTARVILSFRRWLAVGMRDLVFEPQTTELLDRIRVRLLAHCLELYRSGALAGTDPAQAFFVKCDSETNPPDERDLGRVVAHVGLAPSVPAEFIVVSVVHDASGFTVDELA